MEYMTDRQQTAGERVRALRKLRDLTQQQVADAAKIPQGQYAKVEGGQNKLSTAALRAALAMAFEVDRDRFDAYVEGRLPLDALDGGTPALRPVQSVVHFESDSIDPVELALFDVLREKLYAPRVFDAARQAVRESARFLAPGADPHDFARGLLEATASLDRDALPLAPTAILTRFASGKSPHAQASHVEATAATNAEIDARLAARGVTTDDIASNRAKIQGQIAKNRRARGDG